jgi:hypothetical protein
MNRSTRAQIAAGGALPTMMAELVLVVLAAFGLVPWSIWPALVVVPVVLAVRTYFQVPRRLRIAADSSACGKSDDPA